MQSSQNSSSTGKRPVFLNYIEKAKLFTDFFSQQCKLVINDSILPNISYLINEKIEQIPIVNEKIISLIRKLNPNKANGSDGISGQMLLLCDDSVIFPPQNNFQQHFINCYISRYLETC